MRELSLFIDESGDKTNRARYFVLTLVIHNQKYAIDTKVNHYEDFLSRSDLPNIPFHSEPLLNRHGDYEYLDILQRKKMLVAFNVLVQRLPIHYVSFVYKTSEFDTPEKLATRLKRDISGMLFDNLEFFQDFDRVKIYYDNGQDVVRKALDESIGFVLSKQAIIMRKTTMTDYRLSQVADYLCTIELAATKYEAKENGGTYEKFFGSIGTFKKNWLKQARRKKLK